MKSIASDIALTRLVTDPEISTRIYYQFCDLHAAVMLRKEDKDLLLECLIEVMRKLEASKRHRDNVIRLLMEEMERRRAEERGDHCVQIDQTTGAESELESFLMQGRSCLDVLVKVLDPLFGIKLRTYGNGGERVLTALRSNLRREDLVKAEPLLQLIEEDKPWIKKWFTDERATIAHYRSVQSSGFVAKPAKDGSVRHVEPTTKDKIPFHTLVDCLYHNLLTFCEDFIPLALSIKFPAAIILRLLSEDEREAQFPRKYGLAMNLPSPPTPEQS